MQRIKLLVCFLSISQICIAQELRKTQKWTVLNPFDTRAFVQNNGQFSRSSSEDTILFASNFEGVEMYITTKGFELRVVEIGLDKEKNNEQSIKERKKEKEEKALRRKGYQIHKMQWAHAFSPSDIMTENVSSDYFTYFDQAAKTTLKAKGYKKVTLKNIYKGIDIVYQVNENVKGFKYSFILHPGSDPNQIELTTIGSQDMAIRNKSLVIHSVFGEIVHGIPNTFYQQNEERKIDCGYVLRDNSILFKLGAYDRSHTIVIDPWVINPSFSAQNKVYDIETDPNGNIYIYGGQSSFLLKKYSSTGTPIWTYTSLFTDYYGDLAVDLMGNSFITEGYNNTVQNAQIAKIDSNGNVLFSVVGPTVPLEFWCMSFNCDYSKLAVSGGFPGGKISYVDQGNGSLSNTASLVYYEEMRAITFAPNGNFYGLDHQTGNTLSLTQNFDTNYVATTGYLLGYHLPNYNTAFGSGDAGYNGIDAGNHFYVTSDGYKIDKRNLTTGAVLASAPILNGGQSSSGGIQIDNCDKIYVGGINALHIYDSNAVLLTSYPTSGEVYGLNLNYGSKEILVCGDGFIGAVDTFSSCINTPVWPLLVQAKVNCPDTGVVLVVNPDTASSYYFVWADSSTGNVVKISNPINGKTSDTLLNVNPITTYKITITRTNNCQAASEVIFLNSHCGEVDSVWILLCDGETYVTSQGVVISSTTQFLDTLLSSNGQDSVLFISVQFLNSSFSTQYGSFCTGGSFSLPNGTWVDQAEIYYDTLTNWNGCDSLVSWVIQEIHPLNLNLGNDLSICEGEVIELDAAVSGSNLQFEWNDHSNNSKLIIDQAGVYFVSVLNPPCPITSDTILVNFIDCYCKLSIPNAFSPNHDQLNDEFKPLVDCVMPIQNYSMKIYNRWGQEVFYTNDLQVGWNGYFRGAKQDVGNYMYYVQYFNPVKKKVEVRKGDLNLIK